MSYECAACKEYVAGVDVGEPQLCGYCTTGGAPTHDKATDAAIVAQIDVAKAEMFKLEQMVSGDIDNPQRRALYAVRVAFGTVAFEVIGRRGEKR